MGDTIWYKGYVTRSDKGTLTDLSRILYVELLTPDGYLVERQQLEMPDGTAHGAFLLTDSLYAGYYDALDAELRPLRASSLSLHRRDVL